MDDSTATTPSLPEQPKVTSTEEWQRISPIAMLYFLLGFLKILASNFVYMIPAIMMGYSSVLENPTLWLPVMFAVLFLLTCIAALKFYFFQYRLNNQNIEIRFGIIHKNHLNLPFSRIQNIKLEQPLYYRSFNYTCLQLDTAGSSKKEAKIVALKMDFAEQLKQEILASHTNPSESSVEQSSTTKESINAEKEKILNTRSLADLIIHGLSNNRVWIFIGGFAVFFDDISRAIGNSLTKLGINVEQLFSFANQPWWKIGFVAITLTIIILLFMALLSVFGSIITYYNFTLSKLDDRYIRRSGLFTRHEVSMKLSRLQMVVRQQDWLDMLLQRINLKFEQSNAGLQHLQASTLSHKIIVPSVKPEECQGLIDDVYPDNQMASTHYSGISKRFLLRHIAYKLLPLYIIISAFFYLITKPVFIAVTLPIFILLSGLIIMRWRRWGYSKDDNYIYIRSGIFGVDYTCFPLYKIQQTQFIQSLFLKRHGLSQVNFVLASGKISIPFITQQAAYELINQSLLCVEESKRSWM